MKFVEDKIYTALFTELCTNDLFDEDDIVPKRKQHTLIKRIKFKHECLYP